MMRPYYSFFCPAKRQQAVEKLDRAIVEDNRSTVERILQDHTAIVDVEYNSLTPLFIAVRYDRKKIAELLLLKGASPNQKCQGMSALHEACVKNHYDMMLVLMSSNNIDRNIIDCDGNTPLHMAAQQSHERIVRHLVSLKDIDVSIKNNKKQTASALAKKDNILKLITKKMNSMQLMDHGIESLEKELATQYAIKKRTNNKIAVLKNQIESKKRDRRIMNGEFYIRKRFQFLITLIVVFITLLVLVFYFQLL